MSAPAPRERQTGGWRTAILDTAGELSLREGCILIKGKEERELPLSQFGTLVIANEHCTLSAALLNALSRQGTKVILCGGNWEPACELSPLSATVDSAGCVMDQAAWTQENRDRVWGELIAQKLRSQIALLRLLSLPLPSGMPEPDQILPGDPDNREGVAARLYFRALFGPDFARDHADPRNAALNYGYTILRSAVSRAAAAHGYHPALGLHHHSRNNPVNLSCDLMEPFRPFVDRMVWQRGEQELDWTYKQALIGLTHSPCLYGGRQMSLQDALEAFVPETLHALRAPERKIREVGFA